jgi:hypothetical protein
VQSNVYLHIHIYGYIYINRNFYTLVIHQALVKNGNHLTMKKDMKAFTMVAIKLQHLHILAMTQLLVIRSY